MILSSQGIKYGSTYDSLPFIDNVILITRSLYAWFECMLGYHTLYILGIIQKLFVKAFQA